MNQDRTGLQRRRPLHVQYDSSIFALQPEGGIGTYFSELSAQFQRAPELGVVPHAMPGFAAGRAVPRMRLTKLPSSVDRRIVRESIVRGVRAAWAPATRRRLHHSTYYRFPTLRPRGARHVVTVHDMIPELMPEHFSNGNPHRFKAQNVLEADAVICVSEVTRRDLLALYGLPPERIRVTHLAASPIFRPAAERSSQARPYVLYVGQRRLGYKNFDAFLHALRVCRGDVDGVVVGPAFDEDTLARIAALGLMGVVRAVQVDDVQLAVLYQKALALVYPSRYEGFGIPLLEAMASGCPTIVSDLQVFHEVGGDAPLFCHPDDWESFGNAIRLLLEPDDRSERVAAGIARAVEFSWVRTAAATAGIYHDVTG